MCPAWAASAVVVGASAPPFDVATAVADSLTSAADVPAVAGAAATQFAAATVVAGLTSDVAVLPVLAEKAARSRRSPASVLRYCRVPWKQCDSDLAS